ncbi:MAG: hypothetical protein K0R50_3709 [Eubacterium sp.]|nr:hypothetical protein [Eubacterium sp.]
MPKLGMEPFRRAEAINAALECICEVGIEKFTLDMVAEKTGSSKGIVSYYFKSKKQLILESFKAFLLSYKLKITGSVDKDTTPLQMLKAIVETSLPRLDTQDSSMINVSTPDMPQNINLPEKKISKLFIHFISKAANDEDFKNIMREVYTEDVEAISRLMAYAKQVYTLEKPDEKREAYALLAMIYGLSFFRVTGFMPDGETDNYDIAINFLDRLFGMNS